MAVHVDTPLAANLTCWGRWWTTQPRRTGTEKHSQATVPAFLRTRVENFGPTHVTRHLPTTVISETPVELQDREVGPDAPRRDRLFAAASAKGVPLRTILAVDAVLIATWLLYRLVGRLKEIILWILIAAFVALVLNPAVAASNDAGCAVGWR